MGRKRYSGDQIIVMLRESEVLKLKGLTESKAAKKLGVFEQKLYRWKKTYVGLRMDQAKRLKELERKNARLKRLVVDLSLDNLFLKDLSLGERLQ